MTVVGLLVDLSRQLVNCRKRHLSRPCPVSCVLIRQIHKRETQGPWIWKDVVGVSKRQSLVPLSLSLLPLCRSSRALLCFCCCLHGCCTRLFSAVAELCICFRVVGFCVCITATDERKTDPLSLICYIYLIV